MSGRSGEETMDITTLITRLSEAIATDTDIAAWCQTTYDSDHSVYVNYDRRHPPGEAAPAIMLYPTGYSAGRGMPEKRYALEAVIMIHDTAERPGAITTITEYSGVRRIEELREYVQAAIIGADTGDAYLENMDVDYETIEAFPFFMAGMTLNYTEPVTIGTDPLG
jgi:hypothetical protein